MKVTRLIFMRRVSLLPIGLCKVLDESPDELPGLLGRFRVTFFSRRHPSEPFCMKRLLWHLLT